MKDLSPVLNEYAFSTRQITPVQEDVFKVETDLGDFCLKRADRGEHKMLFIYSVLKHLVDQGFTKVSAPVSTKDGAPLVTSGRDIYFLTKWVPGIPCDFERNTHLAAAARTLAEFHRVSRGLDVLSGGKARTMYRKWPEKFAERLADLETFKEVVRKKGNLTDFEKRYLKYADYFIEKAEEACETLKNSNYQKLARDEEIRGTFTHRDVAARNFIIKNGKAYLIDFDYCRYDLRMTDVVRLIERTLKHFRWQTHKAEFILEHYNRFFPLKQGECGVMLAFFQFPQKFWRISDRYFRQKKRWQEEGFLKKLASATRKPEYKEKFINEFAAGFCR